MFFLSNIVQNGWPDCFVWWHLLIVWMDRYSLWQKTYWFLFVTIDIFSFGWRYTHSWNDLHILALTVFRGASIYENDRDQKICISYKEFAYKKSKDDCNLEDSFNKRMILNCIYCTQICKKNNNEVRMSYNFVFKMILYLKKVSLLF